MSPEEWSDLLRRAKADVEEVRYPRAVTFLKAWPSFSRPVCVRCEDGSEFVIKGVNVGKAIVTEQVIGRLAQLLGAPVPHITLVEVPDALIQIEPQMQHIQPGLAHASALVPSCSERMSYEGAKEPANRERFAILAVLYGWALAGDRQLIYDMHTHVVWSVDHGHFFPNGPTWTEHTLSGPFSAEPDQQLKNAAGLSDDDLRPAVEKLATISAIDIARAVATVPDGWPITDGERVAIARYLDERRNHITSTFGSVS